MEDDRTLLVPDFTGNFLFMTLGNLELDPRAGVLFIDFVTGDLLTLTGRAEVVWDGEGVKAFRGAERAWRFHIESRLAADRCAAAALALSRLVAQLADHRQLG